MLNKYLLDIHLSMAGRRLAEEEEEEDLSMAVDSNFSSHVFLNSGVSLLFQWAA